MPEQKSGKTGVLRESPRGKIDKAYQVWELTRKIDNLHIRGMLEEEKRITQRLETRLWNTLEGTKYEDKKKKAKGEYEDKKKKARGEFDPIPGEQDEALSEYLEEWNRLIEKYGIKKYEPGEDVIIQG